MNNIEEIIVDYSISKEHINIVFKDHQTEQEKKIIHDFLAQLAMKICTEGENLE